MANENVDEGQVESIEVTAEERLAKANETVRNYSFGTAAFGASSRAESTWLVYFCAARNAA